MALTSYQRIANGDIDPESPVTTSLVTLLRDNPIAMLVQSDTAPDMMLRRDPLIINHGYNADTLVWNASQTIEAPVVECQNLTISGGASTVITFKRPVTIIRAMDTITIDAKIIADYTSITGSGEAGGASGGGGGGGGGAASSIPQISAEAGEAGVDSQFGNVPGGSAGAINGGNAGSGTDINATLLQNLGALISYYSQGGSNGGRGGNGQGGSSTDTGGTTYYPGAAGGAGGKGGPLLILIAPTIILDTQTEIYMQGGNGGNGANASTGYKGYSGYGAGGGGGGGGGVLVAVTHGINSLVNYAAVLNFNGGAGGNGGSGSTRSGGHGGSGGDGGIYNIELERADEL